MHVILMDVRPGPVRDRCTTASTRGWRPATPPGAFAEEPPRPASTRGEGRYGDHKHWTAQHGQGRVAALAHPDEATP
jgi:hypothetical protein